MSKRVLAAFLVTLFIVATFATVAEVQAHYTLGKQGTNGPEYPMGSAVDEYPDSHQTADPGHLAYVSPGMYYQHPSIQLPNYYSPEGAIITETLGGLNFMINVSEFDSPINITWEADLWLYVAIPPEFVPEGWNMTAGQTTYVATSITNDYNFIKTGKFADDHALAPGWWYVAISAPTEDSPDVYGHAAQGLLYAPGDDPCPDRQIRGGDYDGLYWIWVGGLRAPSIAGKYFFKFFYDTYDAVTDTYDLESFPPENYPTLVVKGELDPGYISGRVLYGGSYYYGYYYGQPIWKPGRVVAEGEAIDPVTNEPTGRKVMGWGYFNASANGFYEIEGLAPGIYKLTAEAAGFPPVTLATEITVKRGQSVHGVNIYVYPGAKIELKVNSKCPTGVEVWPEYAVNYTAWLEVPVNLTRLFPVAVPTWGLYDEEGNVVIPEGEVSWWISEVTDKSFKMYIGDPTSYEGTYLKWDGHVPDDEAYFISGLAAGVYYPKVNVFGYVQLDDYPVVVPTAQYTGLIMREMDIFKGGTMTVTVHFHDQELPSAEAPIAFNAVLTLEAYDADGKLRAWNTTAVTKGDKNEVLDLIGDPDVPYGMPSGTYDIKVFMEGYAQQEFPAHTIQLCTHGELSFHLVKGGNITVTVYSRDWQSPSIALNWLHPPSAIRVYFYNSAGDEIGYVQKNQKMSTDPDPDRVTFNYWGEAGELDHSAVGSGLPTDVYSIKAFTVGYIQRAVPEVWVQKASSTGDIPLYLYAGAAIYITVNFKIEELYAPLPDSAWSYYFRINVYDEEGNLAAANITSVPQATNTQPDGVIQWTFEVLGFNGFTTPGLYTDWSTWPTSVPETGWVPVGRFGYWEPSSIEETLEGYHRDYGIDAGTYTLEVIDETNGYVQTATVAATVSLMGSATIILDMHKQASISGTVYQRNFMGDFRRASWYTVELSGSPASTTCTYDGGYGFWAPAGTYTLKISLKSPDETEAVVIQERTVVVTWGADAGGQNFYLEEGGVPIPEFPAAGVLMLISALAASLYLLRWRKQAIVPMP